MKTCALSLCDIEGGRDLFELVDFRFAFLFTGKEQHTPLVESFLAVSIRTMRLADVFVD